MNLKKSQRLKTQSLVDFNKIHVLNLKMIILLGKIHLLFIRIQNINILKKLLKIKILKLVYLNNKKENYAQKLVYHFHKSIKIINTNSLKNNMINLC